jgi:hypothetical protein
MPESMEEAEVLADQNMEETRNDDNINDISVMEDTVIMANGNQRHQSQQRI